VKEKEERDKLLQSADKSANNSFSKPVLRTTSRPPEIPFLEIKLREFTTEDRSKLTPIQKEIMAFYPTIHLKAHKKGIQIAASQIEGFYKNYIIHKAVFTDVYHYREPDYVGIIAEHTESRRTDVKECQFEPDDRIEVVLFD
jgi:hypothetical protein